MGVVLGPTGSSLSLYGVKQLFVAVKCRKMVYSCVFCVWIH